MQFRVQFLDRAENIIEELTADARNAIGAIELVEGLEWPPRAITMRILDADGLEVHAEVKGERR
jgi:hypothetical protein